MENGEMTLSMANIESDTLALLPLGKGEKLKVALRASQKGVSKPGDKVVGSKDFDRVARDLKALFRVPNEVLSLARKALNGGQCVNVNFNGSRADLVRVGFIEV
jgi:hypothetical protein